MYTGFINEIIGDYSQTIKIGIDNNKVEVHRNGEELFNGIAKHIVDNGRVLSFKDIKGKQYSFTKYICSTSV